ncbi:MAG: biotin transporter BioY [Syntrophomonas sp.]|nr:biotin transporter BioY [Syntrophomonas sp.]
MRSTEQSRLRQMVYAAMFGALTAVGALIVIPLQPLPITLQSFFTGLAGVLLGSRAGALSQVVYVLLGVIGLPVFAGGKAGIGTLFGPSGGYLLGFIVAAYLIGRIVEAKTDPGIAWIGMAVTLGYLAIYGLGTVQLAMITGFSWNKALMIGVVPFIVGDLLKLAACTWLGARFKPMIKLQGG